MVERDVRNAKPHEPFPLLFGGSAVELVTKTGVMARNDRIPLPKYLQMHPEARLWNDDARLFAWTRGERSRLQDDEIQGAGVQRRGQ
jgi:hypothetical protein